MKSRSRLNYLNLLIAISILSQFCHQSDTFLISLTKKVMQMTQSSNLYESSYLLTRSRVSCSFLSFHFGFDLPQAKSKTNAGVCFCGRRRLFSSFSSSFHHVLFGVGLTSLMSNKLIGLRTFHFPRHIGKQMLSSKTFSKSTKVVGPYHLL